MYLSKRWIISGGFRFVADDGAVTEISGVRGVKTAEREDGKVICRVETLDLDAADALTLGTRGTLHGKVKDFVLGEDSREICYGNFEVSDRPLHSGHFREHVSVAVIRLNMR